MAKTNDLTERVIALFFNTLLGAGAAWISVWSYFQTYYFFFRGTGDIGVSHAFAIVFQYGQGFFLYMYLKARDQMAQTVWGIALVLSIVIDGGTNIGEFFTTYPQVWAGVMAGDFSMIVLALVMVLALTSCVFVEEFMGKWASVWFSELKSVLGELRSAMDRGDRVPRPSALRYERGPERAERAPAGQFQVPWDTGGERE